jgi:outer membrane biosynthesis protein TonB
METKKSTTHILAWTPQLEHPRQPPTSTPTPAPTPAPTPKPAHTPASSPAPTSSPTTAPIPFSTPTPTPSSTPAPPLPPTQEPTPTRPYTQHISRPPTFAPFMKQLWNFSSFLPFLSTSHHHLTPSISTTTTNSEVLSPLAEFC